MSDKRGSADELTWTAQDNVLQTCNSFNCTMIVEEQSGNMIFFCEKSNWCHVAFVALHSMWMNNNFIVGFSSCCDSKSDACVFVSIHHIGSMSEFLLIHTVLKVMPFALWINANCKLWTKLKTKVSSGTLSFKDHLDSSVLHLDVIAFDQVSSQTWLPCHLSNMNRLVSDSSHWLDSKNGKQIAPTILKCANNTMNCPPSVELATAVPC